MAMTPQERDRMDKLEKLVMSMLRGENVEFIKTLERRLDFVLIESSSKLLDSEDISINEAGVATKTALDDPDGWIRFGLNQNVPIYND